MKTAAGSTNAADAGAPPVTDEDIDTTRFAAMNDVLVTALRSGITYEEYLKSGLDGFIPTKAEWDNMCLNFRPSAAPSRRSTKRYRQPRNVREFASQASRVASMVLNGEIELEVARTYSSIARVVAQSITAETVRARFLKMAPELEFTDLEEE